MSSSGFRVPQSANFREALIAPSHEERHQQRRRRCGEVDLSDFAARPPAGSAHAMQHRGLSSFSLAASHCERLSRGGCGGRRGSCGGAPSSRRCCSCSSSRPTLAELCGRTLGAEPSAPAVLVAPGAQPPARDSSVRTPGSNRAPIWTLRRIRHSDAQVNAPWSLRGGHASMVAAVGSGGCALAMAGQALESCCCCGHQQLHRQNQSSERQLAAEQGASTRVYMLHMLSTRVHPEPDGFKPGNEIRATSAASALTSTAQYPAHSGRCS